MATKRKKSPKSSSKPKRRSASRPKVRQKAVSGRGRRSDGPREITVFDPDTVESVLDILPEEEQLQSAADLLQGMAHPSRLKALIALSVSELCVGDVAALVGLSLSATSTMLKQLRALGYLSAKSAGKQTYYSLSSRAPEQVMRIIFAEVQTDA